MKTRLQELRKRAGYRSARAFAEHMNIPLPTYTDYEQGKHVFSLERACDFADEFGCTLDELVGRNYSPHTVTDPRRRELLDYWDACSEERRDTLLATARDFATLERFRPERDPVPSKGEE